MSVWLAVFAQAVAPDVKPVPPDSALSARRFPVTLAGALPGCGSADTDDIVVCGGKRDRYRLPLPIDDPSPPDRRASGEAPNAVSVLTPSGGCGLFAGQHACRKADAARYGYGKGRDPVTILTKLGKKILDPDSDVGEPVKIP